MDRQKTGMILLSLATAAALGAAVYGIGRGDAQRDRLNESVAQLEEELAAKEEQLTRLEEAVEDLEEEDLEVYLPEQLYVAVGRTLELYNSQVAFSGDLDEYAFNWVCDIGSNLERKFSVTGREELIGEHALELAVYDHRLNEVYHQEVTLEVVNNEIEDSMCILNIGDSLSDSTSWYEEVLALSQGQITFVGTRGTGDVMHEGRSGFSICDYLTETEYVYAGEGVHPFYNPQTDGFDFAYYKEETGIEPDAVQIFLGKNGMSLDPEPGIAWLEEMVENIRSTDPDIPIYLVQTIYMGDQNGIGQETDRNGNSMLNGWFKLEEDKKVFLWTEAMDEAFGDMDRVWLIPAALTFDSAYNYTAAIQYVNPRSSRTEAVLTEAMHPNNEGYLQIADTMFSVYCKTMKEF